MKKNFMLAPVFLFVVITSVSAQTIMSSDGDRPSWISNVRHRPTSPTSDFIVISAQGQTLNDARTNAERNIRAEQNSVASRWAREDIDAGAQVQYRIIAEHYELRGGRYNLWLLVQIAKRPERSELERIDEREVAKLRRTTVGIKPFVPGMAQIHRGDNVRGALFITGVSALAVGAVTSEIFRADYNDKVNTTFNVNQRRQYIDNAETWQNTRNILIAATGAVYIWNIIDGYASGGGRARQAFDSDFMIVPYADLRGGGVFINFNF